MYVFHHKYIKTVIVKFYYNLKLLFLTWLLTVLWSYKWRLKDMDNLIILWFRYCIGRQPWRQLFSASVLKTLFYVVWRHEMLLSSWSGEVVCRGCVICLWDSAVWSVLIHGTWDLAWVWLHFWCSYLWKHMGQVVFKVLFPVN